MSNTSRKRGYVPKFVHKKDAKKKKLNNGQAQRGDNSQKFGNKKFSKSGGDRRGDRRNDKRKTKKWNF